jgi:hypothetical protein
MGLSGSSMHALQASDDSDIVRLADGIAARAKVRQHACHRLALSQACFFLPDSIFNQYIVELFLNKYSRRLLLTWISASWLHIPEEAYQRCARPTFPSS